MSTIADLLIKIGADSSGLNSELKNAKGQIDKTFEPSPIKGFTDALNSTSVSVEGFASKIARAAALAGAGFGFAQLISGAVEAGSKIHDLTESMGISVAEASLFSRTVSIAGGDIQTASAAIMKLDKTLANGGDSAEKANIMLQAVGVSMTDSTGKLIPVNEQVQALADGYKKAADAGYQQEFLLNTLGSKGLALADVLREYNEAKEQAAKISGIGLDPEEMDKLSKELSTLKMQASGIGLATGAALAPIVEAYLPYIMTGLSETAKFLASNKEEIIDITRYVVAFIAVYKTLQALQAASRTVGGFLGPASSAAAAEEALTAAQERAIAKRINIVQAAAIKEEKTYYQTVQAMEITETEKTAIYAKFVAQRELKTAEEAAAIRNSMTAAYAQVNAAAIQSSTVQTAAMGKVTAATALSKTAMTGVGNEAVVTGAKMTTVAARGVGAVSKLTSAVWTLAGGWLGVASAIVLAIKALVDYNQAYAEGWKERDDVVEYNGKTYRQVKGKWQERGEDPFNREYDNPFLYGDDIKDKSLIEALNQAKENKVRAKFEKSLKNISNDDLKNQLQDAMNQIQEVGVKEKKEKAEAKPVDVEVPIGQIAAEQALGVESGSQWINPDLTSDMERSCASFVSSMYAAAGVTGLYTARVDNLESAFAARGAWYDVGSGYVPQVGDFVSSGDHAGMYIGNDQVRSRDSSGGVTTWSLQGWDNEFGITGYGSISKFTGGQTATRSMLPDEKKENEALKKLQQAKEQALQLFSTMQEAIGKETGTAYETGMAGVAEDVRKKAQEIAQLQKDGVPAAAIKMLTDELATYQTTMQDKVEQKRKESLNKLVTDTAKATAEVKGDYKGLADAEYQSTLESLNKEREERLKEVAKNKSDKEALAAVEDWYTAQTEAAAKKRADVYRESVEKQVEYAIKAHNMIQLQTLLNSQEGKESREWDGRTEAMQRYYDLWKAANVSMDEQMTAVAEKMQNGLSDFFTNLFTGENNFTDSILDLFDSIMLEIINQITEKWSAQIVTSLFGGFLDNNTPGSDGLSLGSIITAGLGGELFGGGGGGDNNGGGITIGDLSTSVASLDNGLKAASGALTIFGGTTGSANSLLTGFNTVQGILNMTTKPAESATTVATTSSLGLLSAAALKAAFALSTLKIAGGLGFASGGYISGPGSGTSDSIPAMLSNGEYVINADAVSRVGAPLLDAINQGRSIRHFASGGLVSGSGGSGIILKAGSPINLNVNALDASSFMDFLRNGGGNAIKQLLLDNDRDYTESTGVW